MTEKLLGGEFVVEETLGQGSFGVVYRCNEVYLDRTVALKMLRADAGNTQELQHFFDEAKHMAKLDHNNVVRIYRFGWADGSPYIVMEFVAGDTLRTLMQRGRLPAFQVTDIMSQVAAGLSSLHDLGIVHRDLSPNNVMVTSDGVAKICDLGLAKNSDPIQTASMGGPVVGTIRYMSPEQLDGAHVGPASDVFSFGVILYEMLANRHPFAAEHFMSVMYHIVHRDPAPLTSIDPSISDVLAAVVSACLQKDPALRPTSLAEAQQVLANAAAKEPDAADPITPVSPTVVHGGKYRNPYMNRVMIKHSSEFFGREREVRRIYARLNAIPPGSVSVVGDRKIGKSSLLNYVYQPKNRREHLENSDKVVMVFLDLQEEKKMSIEQFAKTLLAIAGYELRGRVDFSDSEPNLEGVKAMVKKLDASGYRLLLLLDEFEAVTTNPNFTLEFYSFLRFLANHYNVAYLTSSARDLQALCHTREISDSPFFNIFSSMRLGAFSPEEAKALVAGPSSEAGRPLGAYTDQMIELAGLFPFFLQVACCHAVEYLDENDTDVLDMDEVSKRFYEDVLSHYRHIWETFSESERSVILKVTQGKKLPAALGHVREELERRSYLMPDGADEHLFSSTFAQFIATEAVGEQKGGFFKKLFGRNE